MEMEPGGPTSKKVKLAALESREKVPAPAPPATESAGPDPTATEQSAQPPPAADEDEGGVDHISSLPDPILGEIVSLLFTKQGARTQILSTRWRHIWRSAPLNVDYRRFPRGGLQLDCFPEDGLELDRVVSRIISAHPGPGRRFRIPAYYLQDRAPMLDAWLQSPALDRLQELEFCHDWNHWACPLPTHPQLSPLAPPPASVFRFSPTLRVVTLGRCLLLDSTVQGLHLPHLKQLGLEHVSISEGTLRNLIARCPALECLLIYQIFGLQCARINSPSLISIGVRRCNDFYHDTDERQFRELIIENAPCLERLLRIDILDDLHVLVISAPKLETLGYLFELRREVLQRFPNDSLTTVVGAVKVLSVNISSLDIDMTIELMRCFPLLEKLYICGSLARGLNLWKRKHRILIKCLDIRLKTVIMKSYRGIRAEVNLATFFVLNAKALELMTFGVKAEDYTRGFLAEQRKNLLLEKRASRGARFHFHKGSPLRGFSDINNVRDLNLSDPFVTKR